MADFWHPGAPLALPDSSKLLGLCHVIRDWKCVAERESKRDQGWVRGGN